MSLFCAASWRLPLRRAALVAAERCAHLFSQRLVALVVNAPASGALLDGRLHRHVNLPCHRLKVVKHIAARRNTSARRLCLKRSDTQLRRCGWSALASLGHRAASRSQGRHVAPPLPKNRSSAPMLLCLRKIGSPCFRQPVSARSEGLGFCALSEIGCGCFVRRHRCLRPRLWRKLRHRLQGRIEGSDFLDISDEGPYAKDDRCGGGHRRDDVESTTALVKKGDT